MEMKTNNRYFRKGLLLVSSCFLWMLGACTGDFMETNTDPNAVTEEELPKVFEVIDKNPG